MTIHQSPAPARTDAERVTRTAVRRRPYFREGMLLSVGAAAWAGAILVTGADPADANDLHLRLFAVCSGLFQLGAMALLTVLYRTQALGTGRLARFFLRFEAVLLTLAIGSTVADGLGVSDMDVVGWALLDAFWPLSMLGMFLIGIRIAIAGRWTGVARFWPMVAESWAVVNIPVMVVFGTDVLNVTAALHLLVGYCVLGQIVARKELSEPSS